MADTRGTDGGGGGGGSSPGAMGSGAAASLQPGDLRCCCGRDDCVFLRHNCSVLSSVERDVQAAAKVGQVSVFRCCPSCLVPDRVDRHAVRSARGLPSSPAPPLTRTALPDTACPP